MNGFEHFPSLHALFPLTRSLHNVIVVVSISLLLPNAHWTNTRTKLWCRPENGTNKKITLAITMDAAFIPFHSFSHPPNCDCERVFFLRVFLFASLSSCTRLKSVHRGNFPVIITILMVIWYKLFFSRYSHNAYACYACAACFSSIFFLLLFSIVVSFNSWAGVTGTRGRQSAQYAICIMHFKYYLLFIKNYEHEWITHAELAAAYRAEREKKKHTQSLNWLCHTQKPTMNNFLEMRILLDANEYPTIEWRSSKEKQI